jgi:hypothetical protein
MGGGYSHARSHRHPRIYRITAAVFACAGIAAASTAAATARHWGRQYPATERFKVLAQFGGVAVLDRETQLVWERVPSPALLTWGSPRPQAAARVGVCPVLTRRLSQAP